MTPRFIKEIREFTGEAIDRLSWRRDQVLAHQRHRLREVVAAAQRDSPFHAHRIGHLEAAQLELNDLTRLPPMTKQDVMANWDQLVTDHRLTLEGVNDHLHRVATGEASSLYYLDKYYAAATGGSSGRRGVFVWDQETIIVTANVAHRMDAWYDCTQPPRDTRRTAVICAGSPVHASRVLFPITLDPQRTAEVFPASLPVKEMIERLNAYQPDRIIGYASIVQELCAAAVEGKLQIQPERVSTNSEPLSSTARELAQQAWGINIHNTWGSVETGVAATEGDAFAGMSLAEDFLIVEPVDSEHQPVADAAEADRLLVTRLFGPVMPLIRYELTDTVVLDSGENLDAPGMRRIVEIKGRADGGFVYAGDVRIHPMVFRGVLGQEPKIIEYQVQQTADGAVIRTVAYGEYSTTRIEQALTRQLQDAGLPHPRVCIEKLDHIPRHAETNKLRRFVPMPPAS
ncbi:MAG: hypothetical protein AAGF97_12960 [Planctomycetota bacterium]